jgi:hypothetical protein
MKAKTIFGLVGLALFGTVSPILAAGHGGGGGGGGGGFHGGGGFGGGHFGGGGFHSSGFSGGGHVITGAGSRGGGVGFAGMHPRSGTSNFEGAGPRFSTFGHPSHVQSPSDGSRAQASRPVVARQPNQRIGDIRSHIVARHDANWHGDWDRRHAHFDHGRFFVFIDGFWCGLDSGFYPWDYLPYYANDYNPYAYYTDTDPYDDNGGTYNTYAADSATIQAVQTRLMNLGYYNGSIDGIFGPSTRDAVAKYQIANQLDVTGSLSPDTLQSLGLPQPAAG